MHRNHNCEAKGTDHKTGSRPLHNPGPSCPPCSDPWLRRVQAKCNQGHWLYIPCFLSLVVSNWNDSTSSRHFVYAHEVGILLSARGHERGR
ncbi:hypothetical protein BR93DRAFT_162059 [Coniochaeta sp. PMI_546]|nr:hypothetical protein BR93DRAFT_162059 [Coniochaeta sp. PMI_546]